MDESPEKIFAQIENTALQALKEMRLMIHQLRPSILESEGLLKALQTRLELVELRAGIEVKLEASEKLPHLATEVEGNLYSIALEALNNILYHANATQIKLKIQNENDQLILDIEDNGIGFFPENQSSGIGLKSMHERAKAIDADLSVKSKSGYGTIITIRLNLKKQKKFKEEKNER